MKTTILVLGVLCGGCVVVPKTTTTTKDLGVEQGQPKYGEPKQIALRGVLQGNTIEVHASADRECTRDVFRRTEVRREKAASYRGNKDPRLAVFAAVLAPLTIPISAIGTGIAVLADGSGEATTHTKLVRTNRYACTTLAPNVPLVVQLPSGASLPETTNANGIARVRIPDSEPYAGIVIVTTPDTTARTELRYARAMPAITAVRETVTTCAALHRIGGAVKVELGIDDDGRAVRIQLDAGDGLFAACVNDGIADARFPHAHRGRRLVVPIEVAKL